MSNAPCSTLSWGTTKQNILTLALQMTSKTTDLFSFLVHKYYTLIFGRNAKMYVNNPIIFMWTSIFILSINAVSHNIMENNSTAVKHLFLKFIIIMFVKLFLDYIFELVSHYNLCFQFCCSFLIIASITGKKKNGNIIMYKTIWHNYINIHIMGLKKTKINKI